MAAVTPLQCQVRTWARAHAAARASDVTTKEELLLCAALLARHQPLNYDAYCLVRDQLPPKVSRLLSASLFARLPRGADDVVAPLVLMRYLREAMVLRHVHRSLALYDSVGDGCLREHDLENYIFEAIADAPELSALQDNFYPFYVFTAVRNLFFFLDPNRLGRIRLRDLVGSRALSEWLKVLPPGHPYLGPAGEALRLPEGAAGAGAGAPDAAAAAPAPAAGAAPATSSAGSATAAAATAAAAAAAAAVTAGGGSPGALAAAPAPAPSGAPPTPPSAAAAPSAPSTSTSSPSSPPSSSSAAAATAAAAAATSSAAVGALLAALQWAPPAPSNWFSASNALRVYSAYLELDADQNGMLSPAELGAYSGRLYTSAFVARLFQECHTYASSARDALTGAPVAEIDYKTYLEVVLASENRGALPSQRFFFKLLDVGKRGCFGLREIQYFYGAVQARLRALGQDTVDAGNVADEVLDMLRPATPGVVTFEDLRRSKMGGIVCSMLMDASAFVAYDRREELGTQVGEDASDAE